MIRTVVIRAVQYVCLHARICTYRIASFRVNHRALHTFVCDGVVFGDDLCGLPIFGPILQLLSPTYLKVERGEQWLVLRNWATGGAGFGLDSKIAREPADFGRSRWLSASVGRQDKKFEKRKSTLPGSVWLDPFFSISNCGGLYDVLGLPGPVVDLVNPTDKHVRQISFSFVILKRQFQIHSKFPLDH